MNKRLLLAIMFLLVLVISVATAAHALIENRRALPESFGSVGTDLKKSKILGNNSKEVYRDGILDNYNNYKVTQYISEKITLYTLC
jgi:hypothetical protein